MVKTYLVFNKFNKLHIHPAGTNKLRLLIKNAQLIEFQQAAHYEAEDEGFKPPVRKNRTADFESAPIGHSGNLPESGRKVTCFNLFIQTIR